MGVREAREAMVAAAGKSSSGLSPEAEALAKGGANNTWSGSKEIPVRAQAAGATALSAQKVPSNPWLAAWQRPYTPFGWGQLQWPQAAQPQQQLAAKATPSKELIDDGGLR